VNTGFNVRGEPIVCTPDDADRCFMRSGVDFLVVGDYVLDKKDQPGWPEAGAWRTEIKLDESWWAQQESIAKWKVLTSTLPSYLE